jgi:L-methionine (R)-S-oxide reductase|tara:strand:+ start:174 stop:629 length:456 start_codon:yes stop_codon:yes gene_type:complete
MPLTPNILKSISSLVEGEKNLVANLANISSLLFSEGAWHWVGFYVHDEPVDELVLGPFQGPVACTRLRRGKGVCAEAWEKGKTVLVKDVHSFEGHIACSSATNSEVVVPIQVNGSVVGVLDIDSLDFDGFTSSEIDLLEAVVKIIEDIWER